MVSVTMELFMHGACEIASHMAFAQEMGQDAVNTFDRTMAVQICMEVSGGTLAHMIFSSMTTATDWANDNILG